MGHGAGYWLAFALLAVSCGGQAPLVKSIAEIPAESEAVADDKYIVLFLNGLELDETDLDAAVSAAPGLLSLRHSFMGGISGLAATLTAEDLAYFESLGGIVVRDKIMRASAPVWGLDRIDQADLPLDGATYAPAYDGTGVDIFIIDTGIRADHTQFSGRIGDGRNFVDGGTDPADCNGHGTHCAGSALGATFGVAPGATLHGVKVLNCAGSGYNSDTMAGMLWVLDHPATHKIASMSLGGEYDWTSNLVVKAMVEGGVTVVVAAGNEGGDACLYSPSSAPEAITVGSTKINDEVSYYSNAGSCVDIFAPGQSITSSWFTSSNATKIISGTSMACPHVAGLAAQISQKLGVFSTPKAIWATLKGDAVSNTLTNSTSAGATPGRALPNLFAQTTKATPNPPPSPPAPPSPPPSPPPILRVKITPDSYPAEISWTLFKYYAGDNQYHQVILVQVSSQSTFPAVWDTQLEPGANYALQLYDTNADGFCCSFGQGSFRAEIFGVEVGSTTTWDSSSLVFYFDLFAPPPPSLPKPPPSPPPPSPPPSPPPPLLSPPPPKPPPSPPPPSPPPSPPPPAPPHQDITASFELGVTLAEFDETAQAHFISALEALLLNATVKITSISAGSIIVSTLIRVEPPSEAGAVERKMEETIETLSAVLAVPVLARPNVVVLTTPSSPPPLASSSSTQDAKSSGSGKSATAPAPGMIAGGVLGFSGWKLIITLVFCSIVCIACTSFVGYRVLRSARSGGKVRRASPPAKPDGLGAGGLAGVTPMRPVLTDGSNIAFEMNELGDPNFTGTPAAPPRMLGTRVPTTSAEMQPPRSSSLSMAAIVAGDGAEGAEQAVPPTLARRNSRLRSLSNPSKVSPSFDPSQSR